HVELEHSAILKHMEKLAMSRLKNIHGQRCFQRLGKERHYSSFFHCSWGKRITRNGSRSSWFCNKNVHRRGKLGFGRKQSENFLYSRCDEVSRHDSCV